MESLQEFVQFHSTYSAWDFYCIVASAPDHYSLKLGCECESMSEVIFRSWSLSYHIFLLLDWDSIAICNLEGALIIKGKRTK